MEVLKIRNDANSPWEDILALVGPQGKSAYEIAVEKGFEGTEEEWIISLGARSYDDLLNKPTLEGIQIQGDKTLIDYNLVPLTNMELEKMLK